MGWIILNSFKSKLLRSAVGRHVSGSENPVPQTENNSKILINGLRFIGGVMPDMHPWRVHNKSQPLDIYIKIRMIQMPDDDFNQTCIEEQARPKTKKAHRQKQERIIYNDFQPVIPHVSDPVHDLDRVMHLVELPQERHTMKQIVNAVFQKILNQQEEYELNPERPVAHYRALDHAPPSPCLHDSGEPNHYRRRKRKINEPVENVTIESDVHYVNQQSFPKQGLAFAPRMDPFQNHK